MKSKAKRKQTEVDEVAKRSGGDGAVDSGGGDKAGRPEPANETGSASDAAEETAESAPTVEDLNEKIGSLEDALLRAKADFQNLQRRSAQERSQAVRFANADLIRSMLDVVDDFERSIEASRGSDDPTSVIAGLRLVHENMTKVLRTFGLEPIEALDEPFDPHVHEAMLQQPSRDHPPGTVIKELTKGYRLHDRVLRPAKVVVSKATEEPGEREPDEDPDRMDAEAGNLKK